MTDSDSSELLEQSFPTCLDQPCGTPIAQVLQFLNDHHQVQIQFRHLGYRGSYRILGQTIFSQRTICLDEELVMNPSMEVLFRSVGAHEIGHWILHSGRPIVREQGGKPLDEIVHIERDLFGKKILRTQHDWIEHHAKVFAGFLLMPRQPLMFAVHRLQREMGITRNLGTIYLDDQPSNQRDYATIIQGLLEIFGTSRQGTQIQLERLEIVQDWRRRLRHISELQNIGEFIRDRFRNNQ